MNFDQTTKGAEYITAWWQGPLSPHNNRGQTQFMPSNLIAFDSPTKKVAENPALPENQRDLQFTVNGQFQPELKIKPGQTEIWTVANISDIAYMTVRLTETATGNHPKFSIVGQDGNPYTQVGRPVYGDGTTLDIPPASRFAIAVTMPKQGDLVLEFPPDPRAKPIVNPGVLYTNNGTKNPPAVLGTLHVDPKYVSYADGFFVFPTQTLLRATPDTSGQGQTTAFEPGQNLDAYTSFVDTSVMTPAVKRALTITGGFGNKKANNNDPKSIVYMFDDNTFPNIPLIQPRLNSVEEWLITNFNNDAHPMHIHVNDFQVTDVDDPNRGHTGVQPFGVDNTNVPAPLIDENHVATTPASLTLRQEFLEFPGTYVIHCHRLNHEDNGLMALINVIPEVSTYAVAIPGSSGKPASVQVRDANGDKVLQTVFPFPDFEGTPSVAMADINGDGILDLVVGTGKGASPEVVAYDGNNTVDGLFKTELTRFAPFDSVVHRWRDGCGRRHRRKRVGGQHHRRLGSRHGIAGEGLLVQAVGRVGQGAGRVLHVHALPRLSVGGHPGHRHGRGGIWPRERGHGARARRRATDQGVPVGPLHPDGTGAGQWHGDAGAFGQAHRPEDDIAVHGVRRELQGRCRVVDRMGRGRRGRREEHRHQPARR